MSFEIFIKGEHHNKREMKFFITISGHKRIFFSLPCAIWFSSMNAKKVEYLWDADTKTVAFRPAANGYSLNIGETQAHVSATLFLDYIGRPTPGRYTAIVNDEQNMIVVQMNKIEEK